jgi:hypothetical protein
MAGKPGCRRSHEAGIKAGFPDGGLALKELLVHQCGRRHKSAAPSAYQAIEVLTLKY